ncbi:MAG: YhcB family protein, partial [Marinicellaceae bacterium]
MSDQIFYYLSAILLGLVIGALIMYFANGSTKDSDKTIAKLEKELEDYQHDVAEHFEQTADLVDDMTKSYKKVFDHLGKSARLLMTEEQIQKQLELRKGNKVTLEYLTESHEENQIPDDSNDSDQEDHNSIAQVEDAPVLPQNENESDSEIETIDDTSN